MAPGIEKDSAIAKDTFSAKGRFRVTAKGRFRRRSLTQCLICNAREGKRKKVSDKARQTPRYEETIFVVEETKQYDKTKAQRCDGGKQKRRSIAELQGGTGQQNRATISTPQKGKTEDKATRRQVLSDKQEQLFQIKVCKLVVYC
jgi:hypothetical protein